MDFVKQNNLFWTLIYSVGKIMIGKRIKDERQLKGLTQSQLAEKIGTTQSTIGKYEREELQPNIEVIIKICKVLEISSDYLLGLED